MSDRLDRLYDFKYKKSLNKNALKTFINSDPRLDDESITALIDIFARHYEVESNKREKLVDDITSKIKNGVSESTNNLAKYISKEVMKVAESQKDSGNRLSSADKKLSTVLDNLSVLLNNIEKVNDSVKKAPDAYIESLSNGINAILMDIEGIKREIATLKKDSEVEVNTPEIDLTPVIEAINEPLNVEFKIEYDQWDFPDKVIAKEVK